MRYSMMDPRAPGRPVGAMMPQPAISPSASSNGLMHVTGHPGTMAVAAPRPSALPQTAAGTRSNQPSHCSPDVMFPSIYVPSAAHCHPPVGLLRDNQLPVPAARVYNLPRVSQRTRRVGGANQVGQPAVIQTWPEWRGR